VSHAVEAAPLATHIVQHTTLYVYVIRATYPFGANLTHLVQGWVPTVDTSPWALTGETQVRFLVMSLSSNLDFVTLGHGGVPWSPALGHPNWSAAYV
jgi:hypothetical protein